MIDSFSKLISLLESNPKNTALIVMFKSPTCPPCKQTIAYLTSISSSGEIVWFKNQKNFEKEHGYQLHFMPVDLITMTIDNNEMLFPILSAAQSVRGFPTFDFFVVENNKLKRVDRARHAGGLGPGSFETYLDTCSHYLSHK